MSDNLKNENTVTDTSWLATAGDAQEATAKDHSMSVWQAVKRNKKSVFWALGMYMGLIMESYDAGLVGSLIAYPAFRRNYGEYSETSGDYQISAPWQVAMGLSTSLGLIIGVFLNSIFVDKWGYRKVLLVGYTLIIGLIFIPFFAPNIGTLFAGEMLCGIVWGLFAVGTTAYVSEVVFATALRGYLQVYANLCAIMGQLIAAGVLQGLVDNDTQWSYRIPFAIQWVWPVPLALLTFFAPESPWWLIRQGRLDEAEHVMSRLNDESAETNKQTVAMMIHTNDLEKEINEGISYLDCFKGANLRRTEILCVINSSDCLCGFAITSILTYFFESAGVAASDSYKLGLGTSAMAFVGTCLNMVVMRLAGRRTIGVIGLGCLTSFMLIIGILACVEQTPGIMWAQPVLLMIWTFTYDLTVGPVTYALNGEVSATRLRAKTMSLGRNTYNIVNVVNAVAGPYILNPDEANWKGKAGFLAGGISLLIFVWSIFRLPETKGRTYEELDLLFEQRVPAWRFKSTSVDAYGDEDEKHVITM